MTWLVYNASTCSFTTASTSRNIGGNIYRFESAIRFCENLIYGSKWALWTLKQAESLKFQSGFANKNITLCRVVQVKYQKLRMIKCRKIVYAFFYKLLFRFILFFKVWRMFFENSSTYVHIFIILPHRHKMASVLLILSCKKNVR